MNAYEKEDFGTMKSDISWIKEANKQQNINIKEQSQNIKELGEKLDAFIIESPNKFACKATEEMVALLSKKIAYGSGAIAVILIIIELVTRYL